jgi:hypothetical protein
MVYFLSIAEKSQPVTEAAHTVKCIQNGVKLQASPWETKRKEAARFFLLYAAPAIFFVHDIRVSRYNLSPAACRKKYGPPGKAGKKGGKYPGKRDRPF